MEPEAEAGLTGDKMREMRVELGYTQGHLARLLIVARSRVWRWETTGGIPDEIEKEMLRLWKKSFPHVCPWCKKLTV